MDYQKIQFLEMIAMYSLNDFEGLQVPEDKKAVLELRCRLFIDMIIDVAKEYAIKLDTSLITSDFDGKIQTIAGLSIGLSNYSYEIDCDLYNNLAQLAQSNKRDNKLKICLGYGERIVNIQNTRMSASLVAGTYSPLENIIYLDINVYKCLGLEAMILRFAHEMLHEFGYDEKDTLENEFAYYEKIKEISKPLLTQIYGDIEKAEIEMLELFGSIYEVDGALDEAMELCDELQEYGALKMGSVVNIENPINNEICQFSIY